LTRYRIPEGEGIRVDDGYREAMDIPIHYDPMIAKLIVHAPSRQEALEKMKEAIDQYEIDGVDTTLAFGKFVMSHPEFVNGHFDTHFVEKHMNEFLEKEEAMHHTLARFVAWLYARKKSILRLPNMES
jgi:acetyl/propionyl-CoA carboxylase alpha subunit